MVFRVLSRLTASTLRVGSCPVAFGTVPTSGGLTVEHDRANRRFTVSPGSGAGAHEPAVLTYRFTAETEVDLMSTYVPEAFRGQGVAALLSQAAIDFVVEENLRFRVSCWYIQKYMEENPLQQVKDLVVT